MNGLSAAQRGYDRYLPEDNRSDAQIEGDAAEAAAERVRDLRRAELLRNPSKGLQFVEQVKFRVPA